MSEPVAAEFAQEVASRAMAFRAQWEALSRPDDVNALLGLFPSLSLREGYELDYIQESSPDGVRLPIHPFARPRQEAGWTPMVDSAEPPNPDELVETLYPYLSYQATASGLFEYAFFHLELFSLRANAQDAEWLSCTPVFTQEEFDRVLAGATRPSEVVRPSHYGPLACLEGEDRSVRFLVYTPMGWERIYYLESAIRSDGHVEHQAGDVLADMGLGQIF